MFRRPLIPIIILLSLPAVHLSARVIYVPGDKPTIQGGINLAVDGDTVLIAPGTYTEHEIDFLGKAIRVTGTDPEDPAIIAATVVDANDQGVVFLFHSGEDSASVITGLTLTNGNEEQSGYGGGIYCDASSPTITNNTIRNNFSDTSGGGIHCLHASPTITNNIIADNEAISESNSRGGGIYCEDGSSPLIIGNTITGNFCSGTYAGGLGGGIYCSSSSPTIADNIISENSSHSGGGIECSTGSSPIISGNMILNNHTFGGEFIASRGGGITCNDHSTPVISGNFICGNWSVNYYSAGRGGGIYSIDSSPMIEHNVIAGNKVNSGYSSGYGAGIYLWNSSPTISNNVITENTINENGIGGGIACYENSSVYITNTILYRNSSGLGSEIGLGESSILTIRYSDVGGGVTSVYVDQSSTLIRGPGMIDADPLFVLPDQRDYRLLWGSPCIDNGDPGSFDPDMTRGDMGPFYYDQSEQITLYLTPDITEVVPGGELGVTYTLINRWTQPETFCLETDVILPDSTEYPLFGPDEHTLRPERTVQVHTDHDIPMAAPPGVYEYRSRTLYPLATVPGEDRFTFRVTY